MRGTYLDAMKEGSLCDTYSSFGTALAMASQKIADAERERVIHRAHLRDRAQARLHRAVVLGRRSGLDDSAVERELAALLVHRTQN